MAVKIIYDQSVIDSVVELYNSGKSFKVIAETLNIKVGAVRKIASENGVQIRKSGGSVTYDPQIAIRMWEDGQTLEQIGEHLGVNRTSIYEQLLKFNIDTTPRRLINRETHSSMVNLGKTDQEIAEELNCSLIMVQRIRSQELNIKRCSDVAPLIKWLDENPDCGFTDAFLHFDGKYDSGTIRRNFIAHRDLPVDHSFSTSTYKKDLLQITDENFDEFKADVESGRMRRSQIQEKFKIKSRVAFIRLLAMYDLTPNFYQYIMPIETHDKLGSVEWCKRIVEEKYNGHFPGAQTIASIELDDVVGPDVVRAWFERHGLPFASSLVEEIHPQLLNRKWMEVEYKTKSIREIADEVGVSHPIISRFLTHHNIEIKQESHTSKGEKQVLNFIKQYYKGQIIENDRIIIGPKELDIVLPDLKIAIEYCGMYWHCEKMARDPRNIHSNKRKLAEERGYRLITIFENEWLEKDSRKKIKNKILSIIGASQQRRIFARKCDVVDIDNNAADEFMNANHIQGSSTYSIRKALVHEGTIVAVLGLKVLRETKTLDLTRFATCANVVGGFSKLLKSLKSDPLYGMWPIVTFADLRWSCLKTNMYVVNGFKLSHITSPAYHYYHNSTKKLWHRMHFQKKNLGKLLRTYDPNLTERQNANANGYYAIYDCGHAKYTYYP